MKLIYYLLSFLIFLQIPLLANSVFWKAINQKQMLSNLNQNYQKEISLQTIDQPIKSYGFNYLTLDNNFVLLANKNTKTNTEWWLFNKSKQTFVKQSDFETLGLNFTDFIGKSNFEQTTYLVFSTQKNYYSYYNIETHNFFKFNNVFVTQNNISPNYHYELWTSTNRNKGIIIPTFYFRANFSFIKGTYQNVYDDNKAEILSWISLIEENKKPHFSVVNKSPKNKFIDNGPFFELIYQDTYGALIQYNQENFSFPNDHLRQYYFSFRPEHNNLILKGDINQNINYFTFDKFIQSNISQTNTYSINENWIATNLENKSGLANTLISYTLNDHKIETETVINFDQIFAHNDNFLLYSFDNQLFCLDLNSKTTSNLHFKIEKMSSIFATQQSGFFLKQSNKLYYINPASFPISPFLIMETNWDPVFFSNQLLILKDQNYLYPLDWSFLDLPTTSSFRYLSFNQNYYWATNDAFILYIDERRSSFLSGILDILSVKVNDQQLSSSDNNQSWKINLLYFLNKINPTTLNIEIALSIFGNNTKIAFNFLIMKDYLPSITIKDVINNRIITPEVYFDSEQNIYDGYEAKNNTLITFEQLNLIDSIFINEQLHNSNTLLIQVNHQNHLKIVDVFNQTWNYYPIYSKEQAKFTNFWQSEIGQNLTPKALNDGYSEEQLKSLNAHQIITLINRIDNLFYINDLLIDTQTLLSDLILINHDQYFLSGLTSLNSLVGNQSFYLIINELIGQYLTNYFVLDTNLESSIDFNLLFYTNDVLIDDFNLPLKQDLKIKILSQTGGRLLGSTSLTLLDNNSLMFVDLNHLSKKHFYYNDVAKNIDLKTSGINYFVSKLDNAFIESDPSNKVLKDWSLFSNQLTNKMQALLYEWVANIYFPTIDNNTPHFVNFPISENELDEYVGIEIQLVEQFGVHNTQRHFRWSNTKKIIIKIETKNQGLFVNDFSMIYYNPWFKGFDYPVLFWTLFILLIILMIILCLLIIRVYNNKKFTKQFWPEKAKLSKLVK